MMKFNLLITIIITIQLVTFVTIDAFEEISISLTIDEERPNGTKLIDLSKYFNEQHHEDIQQYQREFLHPCHFFYFGSDDKTQWHIFVNHLDRENLCPYEEQCHLICQFYLKKDQMKLVQIHLFLRDVNDHRGQFIKDHYFFELDENLPLGFRLQLEQVYDPDFYSNHKTYQLNVSSFDSDRSSSRQFPFDLSFDSTKHLLELILIDQLDANKQSSYHFQLISIENQYIEDQCHIEISIRSNHLDSQQIPSFQQAEYHFLVDHFHSKSIGQVRLNISDNKDTSMSKSKIFFRILSSKSQLNDQQFDLFRLNETTGELFFADASSSFRFNQNEFIDNQQFQLIIEAFNTNFLSSLTTVFIHFNLSSSMSSLHSTNINDDPHFLLFIPKRFQQEQEQQTITSDQHEFIIRVSENTPVPLTLCQLFISTSSIASSSSSSSTSNTKLNEPQIQVKSSFDSDAFLLQQVDDHLFDFVLLRSLDYELVKNISIIFLLNRPSQFEQQQRSLTIIVENQNDCSPVFTQQQFHFQVEENQLISTTFFTFQAQDQDQDDVLQFYFNYSSIEEEEQQQLYQSLFHVDPTNGHFLLLQSFDRETQSNYSFDICVDDQLHHSCVPLHLQILDQNDHECSFPTADRIDLDLHENLPPNTFLTRFVAHDPDQDENGTLSYSFASSSPYLHLNSSTGLLTTTSIPFDHETIQNYSITLIACDNIHRPRLSRCCSIDLFLHVQDQNDHEPHLIYPSLDHKDIFVIRYVNQTMMPMIKALDQDLDKEHNRIDFKILGGTLNGSLNIHPDTGQLILQNPSSTHFPLYGTLLLSLSSETMIPLTLLIHDNHTDPEVFLRSIRSATSFSFYYYYYFIMFVVILLLLPFVFLIPQVLKSKTKRVTTHHAHSLLGTTSTTTLSSKSLSNHKRSFETYYSFGDTLAPNCTQI